jgi:hypothetical protein
MRVVVRFKNDKDRAKGSYALAETGPIVVLKPGVYLVRQEQLRALKDKNGKKKFDYELVDLQEVGVG